MTEPTTAAFWEDHYAQRSRVWSGRPNAVLVDEVGALPAGLALDLGCGEGGDAVWLAERGWRVVAVDVSQTALDRAASAAEAAGVADRIEWQRHDLAQTFPSGAFDLVSAQFLQSPIDFPVERVLRSAAAAVGAGGTLLIVSHAAPPAGAAHGNDHAPPGGFPDPAETATAIGLRSDDWDLVACELRERPAAGHAGEPTTLVDGVIRAARRA